MPPVALASFPRYISSGQNRYNTLRAQVIETLINSPQNTNIRPHMKPTGTKPTRKTNRTPRGLIETTLLKIARASGFQVIPVSPTQMAKAKGESRREDNRRIQNGEATPAQIQKKNDMVPGPIEVLDWSPVFA
jgi:hypothetical protein